LTAKYRCEKCQPYAGAKTGEAGDVAPIAAALAVAERVAAAASPDAAVDWASPGSVAATTALGKSLAGCLIRHAEAVVAAVDAVAGNDDDALATTLRDEPSSSSIASSSASSSASDAHRNRMDSNGGSGGGGGIGALRRYLAATGHREAPSVLGGAAGSGPNGHVHALLGSCGVGGGYSHLALPPQIALEDAASAAQANDAQLTYDDAAEALDWLCRTLTVPHALRAAERGAAAAAAGLVARLSARVGDEQTVAASRLRKNLTDLSSAVHDFCAAHQLSPDVFPGRAGIVDAWAPEGMNPQNWGEEFTVESLEALVATLGSGGGGGSGSDGGSKSDGGGKSDSGNSDVSGSAVGKGGETLPWDVLINLALWLDEEAGWWWHSTMKKRAGRRLALRWHTPRGIALATTAVQHLAAAVAAASDAARSLAVALPAAAEAVAEVPWASAAAAATASAVGDAVLAMGGGQEGVYDAELKVARNATFGAAMYETQGRAGAGAGAGATSADTEAEGERWYAIEWLVATTSAVASCAWDSRTAAAAAAELRRVPPAAQGEKLRRLAVKSSLSLETAALATVGLYKLHAVDLSIPCKRLVTQPLNPKCDTRIVVSKVCLLSNSQLGPLRHGARRQQQSRGATRGAFEGARRGEGGGGGGAAAPSGFYRARAGGVARADLGRVLHVELY
jgi:uncharacterized membrane protein YgcG